LNATYYRWSKVSDYACKSPASGCSEYTATGDWTEYTGEFNIDETSCHVIQYYSIDNVEKTETIQQDCIYVDNEAPITTYEITGPSYDNGTDTFVDNASRLFLTCEDDTADYESDLHAVGEGNITYKIDYANGTSLVDWMTYNSSSDGIWFPEESHHLVSYYCTDLLGNVEDTDELDLYVDHSAPTTTLEFESNYSDDTNTWISATTGITLIADDGDEDHDSGVNKTYYRWSKVDNSYCYGTNESGLGELEKSYTEYDGSFVIDEDSCHVIEYYSVDNVEKTEEANREFVLLTMLNLALQNFDWCTS